VHTIGACALDASWAENVFCNALPLGAAVILSGADVRAAHAMTFAATFSAVAVHSGRGAPRSVHRNPFSLGAGWFVDWATRGEIGEYLGHVCRGRDRPLGQEGVVWPAVRRKRAPPGAAVSHGVEPAQEGAAGREQEHKKNVLLIN
jgi:hypothetical protein